VSWQAFDANREKAAQGIRRCVFLIDKYFHEIN